MSIWATIVGIASSIFPPKANTGSPLIDELALNTYRKEPFGPIITNPALSVPVPKARKRKRSQSTYAPQPGRPHLYDNSTDDIVTGIVIGSMLSGSNSPSPSYDSTPSWSGGGGMSGGGGASGSWGSDSSSSSADFSNVSGGSDTVSSD